MGVFDDLSVLYLKHALIATGLGFLSWRIFNRMYHKRKLTSRLARKKEMLQRNIDHVKHELTNLTTSVADLISLVDKDLSDLCAQVNDGSLKPSDLLHAFQAKALELYEDGNSGVAEFILEAEADVNNLEREKVDGESRSPLYGIPISLKETCAVSGYDATVGLIKRCGQPMVEDGVVVKVLKATGAIPFVLTATTQAARTLDGFNPVHGNMCNPYVNSCIPGGSSAGEGVLLSRHGSPVGIGSDIGGSIRIPAAFCGLASLKPSLHRISAKGMASTSTRSVFLLRACLGPMGRKVEDLARVMRTLLCQRMFDLDSYVIPMPFDEDSYKGKNKPVLRIGFYDDFCGSNFIHTVPVVRSAVYRAAAALEKAGHNIVKFSVPNPSDAYELSLLALFADGGCELKERIKWEPMSKHLRFLHLLLGFPNWIKCIAGFLAVHFFGKPLESVRFLRGAKSVKAMLDIESSIAHYKQLFESAWDVAGPLDALICPVMPFPAPPISASSFFVTPSIFYTMLYNLLDYPAGTVPTGFVDRIDVAHSLKQAQTLRFEGYSYQAKVLNLQIGSEGLPLSVQVVSKPYREEIVLRVMKEIEANVGKLVL